MPRAYAIAVGSAAIVGIGLGVVLHNVFGAPSARARPSLPALYGQATWKAGAAPAPPVALRDQHGRRFTLASLRGHAVVLAFMDSLCKAECPLEAAQLEAAMRPLPAGSRPRLVIVSVDLADTPRSVAAAARKWHLAKGFEWLLGTRRELAPVWRSYGIEVLPTRSGDVAHSDAFYVIDAHGDKRAAFLSPFIPGLVTRDLARLAV